MRYVGWVFFAFISFLNQADATSLYKHTLPFTISVKKNDILTVYYDFSAKSGILCKSESGAYKINFTHKGHLKSALLPIIIQNRHIPAKNNEVLADISGKFTLAMTNLYPQETAEVRCEYVN